MPCLRLVSVSSVPLLLFDFREQKFSLAAQSSQPLLLLTLIQLLLLDIEVDI